MKNKLITIRSIEEKDLNVIQSWNFDEETSKYFSPRLPISSNEQKKWFEGQVNSPSKKKLIIEDNQTKELIGMIGIMNIDHVNKNCEVGITIGNHTYLGKGIASSSLKLVVDFLFYQMNMHMIYLTVLENNKNAVKFFEKFGFRKQGLLHDILFIDNKYQSYVWMNLIKENQK